MIISADVLRQRLGRAARTVDDQPLREAFGDDVLYLLPHEFIAVVSRRCADAGQE